MSFRIGYFVLVVLSWFYIVWSASKCPTQPPCPGHCALGRDANECEICSCGANQTCPPQPPCPGHCALGRDANECEICSCGGNQTCPPQPPCPGHCAVGRDVHGCMLCECGRAREDIRISLCPPLGMCSLKCSLDETGNGCKKCTCPDGVKPDEPDCGKDKKCADPGSECSRFGFCICKGLYERGKKGCVKRPQFGESCLVDGKYLLCMGYGVDVNCYGDSKDHKCKCLPGYEPDGDKKTCKPKDVKLHQKCDTDSDCVIAYSHCVSGKCACIDGFKDEDPFCKPEKYNCPSGEPGPNGKVTFCQLKYNTSTYRHDIDTCPKDAFCFTAPGVFSEDKNYAGICCSRQAKDELKIVCPVGNIHPIAKCPPPNQIEDVPLSPEFLPFCPLETHECIGGQRCCPVPCRRNVTGFFSVDNVCYDHVILDQECKVSAQCNQNAECVQRKGQKSKTCQCNPGFEARDKLSCYELPTPRGGSPRKGTS